MHPIATTLNQIKDELNASFLERNDAIEAMLLALLSGEHVFLLGPPGTAKSQLVRALVQALRGASYFEQLLSKTRPAEAVNGPLDVKEFRETGNYVIKRKGFATDVDLLFLDEAGKMSPVLGHDLLALLNERVYHEVNGGRSVHAAPLHTAFTASNEVPTGESDDAAAMWDRLLFRVLVDYLSEPKNFASLLTADVAEPTTKVDFAEVKNVTANEVPGIELPDVVVDGLTELRMKMARERLYPSDRRWRASVKALKAAAFLAGREQVTPRDIAVLRYTLWDTPEQIEAVTALCFSAANPYAEDLAQIKKGLMEIRDALRARENDPEDKRASYGREANSKLVKARTELDGLITMAAGEELPGLKQVSDLHRALDEQVAEDFLLLPPDVKAVYLEKRRGLGDGTDPAFKVVQR